MGYTEILLAAIQEIQVSQNIQEPILRPQGWNPGREAVEKKSSRAGAGEHGSTVLESIPVVGGRYQSTST
jgi:hypothetical protein